MECISSCKHIGQKCKYHKHTDALLKASREIGLEVNREKTKYMVMLCHQNA